MADDGIAVAGPLVGADLLHLREIDASGAEW